MKNHSVIETLSLEEYAYDNYYMEFGVCNDFSRLNFLTTSSQIDGYSKLQTYYLITNLNEYLECFVYDKECNCVAVNNQTIIESIQKSNSSFYFSYLSINLTGIPRELSRG